MPRALRGALKDKANSTAAALDLSRAYTSGVLLAHTYEKQKPPPNPEGWWVSEKLDGVRAYWNGESFVSRSGNQYFAPAFFTEGLPKDIHLDGELWLGRERFEECVGIVRTANQAHAENWRSMLYVLFDAPVVHGRVDLAYEERHACCERVAAAAPFASAVQIRKCTGEAHMKELLTGVISNGGEGLMLREPASLYERTRSRSLLKVKTFLDAEARVIGHSNDSKIQGCMGALECAMPVTGVTFKIGSGFRMDEKPMAKAKAQWPVGTVVSYKYQGLTTANSKPRFPTYLRIRTDKTWGEVEADARADLEFAELGASGSSLVRAPSLMEKTSPKTSPVNMPAKVPVEPIQTPNSPRELAKDSGTEDDSVAHLQRTGKKRRSPKRAGSGGVGVDGEIVGGGGSGGGGGEEQTNPSKRQKRDHYLLRSALPAV